MDDRTLLTDAPEADSTSRADETTRGAAMGLALLKAKHDLNNLFHVARGWSRLLKDPRSGLLQTQEGIDAVLAAAEQTSELVNGILSLGTHVSGAEAICNLTHELAGLARGLRYLLPAPEQLRVELDTQILVLCNFADVRRALLDCVFAIRGALGGDDDLRLCLRDTESTGAARNVELTLERRRRNAAADANAECYLRLRFSAEKRAGPNAEATLLPAFANQSAEPSHVTSPGPSSTAVLLVDDHRDVRRLATTMLERAGYQVLTACDAEEALVTSQSYDGPIHLLCCDAQMPGLPSVQLIAELRAARPDLKVLVCTGVRPHGRLAEFPHLSKPFSYQQLLSAVRGCLE